MHAIVQNPRQQFFAAKLECFVGEHYNPLSDILVLHKIFRNLAETQRPKQELKVG